MVEGHPRGLDGNRGGGVARNVNDFIVFVSGEKIWH